jgi:hypothetical protein
MGLRFEAGRRIMRGAQKAFPMAGAWSHQANAAAKMDTALTALSANSMTPTPLLQSV